MKETWTERVVWDNKERTRTRAFPFPPRPLRKVRPRGGGGAVVIWLQSCTLDTYNNPLHPLPPTSPSKKMAPPPLS